MKHKLNNELIAYFESKQELNEQEKQLLKQLKLYDDCFGVSFVTKEDVEQCGFKTDSLTDDDMQQLADRMGDAICDCGYWDILSAICSQVLNLEEKDE